MTVWLVRWWTNSMLVWGYDAKDAERRFHLGLNVGQLQITEERMIKLEADAERVGRIRHDVTVRPATLADLDDMDRAGVKVPDDMRRILEGAKLP